MVTLPTGQRYESETAVLLLSTPFHGLMLSYSLHCSGVQAVVPGQAPLFAVGEAATRELKTVNKTEVENSMVLGAWWGSAKSSSNSRIRLYVDRHASFEGDDLGCHEPRGQSRQSWAGVRHKSTMVHPKVQPEQIGLHDGV